ncbi:MFS transporter [Mesorhizobium sp. M2D.F.Ca.ET.185.01.1.1]|uniref:MFS transporter n=2 Tax=Mesorhizobium TaxID=68287 RepID=UPI000FCB1659|nr:MULTISPECIES: MFS transporter [unclassified Mesorhizobium]TGP80259.1 MFS transporter [bacterium M00.F.Ca.ET.227.01.1.1]TGQ00771.1 MFS transporter [bacterium M00.F.Ca.ET.221.01.1.1]TGQ02708.1 MFS transporter [bacterium M00.F.Ca.ET.222.01.1.1]TGT97853.1 MFS transporter [bacterium M00.F.Ca.ET.163.01.1.1]TGU20193.1 MFS transporter [bacterium M00.F.Ca.ET.156.01.1.1]TGU44592.1 MFS transporter [bacterium M00.F.Ca.ET.146.01.1.1]TGV72321.1 MFS transporter [Mesorhizobium sp. M2D.F.Ca.ET.160.01.1.1]
MADIAETRVAPARHSTPGALAGLSLAMLLSSLGTSIANVALPTLSAAFAASFPAVQWVVLAYLLAITALIVSVGRLGDLVGRRLLLIAGLALFSTASLAAALAPSLALLIAARAVQGLGAAVMMALTIAFVGETVPKQRTGSAMGLLGTMSAIGTALGPSLGGVLIVALGWRSIFLVNAVLGVVAVFAAWRFLPAGMAIARGEARGRFDTLGTLLLAATLAAYAMAMTMGRGHFGGLNLALLGIAVVGTALFVVAEAKVASPLVKLALLRDPVLAPSLAMNALVSTVMMATLVVGPFFLSRALGLSETAAGAVLSIGPVVSALCGILAGRVVDRLGAAAMVIAGLAMMAAGCAALAALPGLFGVAGYAAASVLLTPGYQLFQAANNTAVMADVDSGERGVVSAMLSLSRNLGLVTGAAAMGAVFALAVGTNDIAGAAPAAVARGMGFTFAVAAGLMIAAMVIAFSGDWSKRHSA